MRGGENFRRAWFQLSSWSMLVGFWVLNHPELVAVFDSRVFARFSEFSYSNEFQADSARTQLGTINKKKTRENARERANALRVIRGHPRHPRESAAVPKLFQAGLGAPTWNDFERGSTRISADNRGLIPSRSVNSAESCLAVRLIQAAADQLSRWRMGRREYPLRTRLP